VLRRIRQECKDLVEFVLIPGLAAVLPWTICFQLFKWLSRRQFLYRAESERALRQANALGWVTDAKSWIAARRLTTLVDHADQYLALSRSDAWLKKHMHAMGEWPFERRAAIFCTFHWGAGMWALRHAAAAGVHAHMLVAEPTSAAFKGRTTYHRYIRSRIASIARILRRPTFDSETAMRHALTALRGGEPLMAVVDVPADQVSASEPITLIGMPTRVPRALFRLAVDRQLPLTVFWSGFDYDDGSRFIQIKTLGVYQDVQLLIRDVFLHLETVIKENPPAWHFWGESARFFRRDGTN